MSFMLGSAGAAEKKSGSKVKNKDLAQQYRSNSSAKKRPSVIWVNVIGSHIPQRISVTGQHPDTASNVYVVQGDELNRAGATSVAGMLALEPSITFNRRPR
ncbi:MAG: hypothetical protein QOE73_480 [Verrucomicrobiota bacterium]|jgi:hypothetical protein